MQKLGAAIYGRKEGAKRWLYRNRNNRRPFYYNHIAISPFSDKETYHYNISFDRTTDGGKTFVAAGRGGGGGGGGGGFGGGGGGAAPPGRGMHWWAANLLDPAQKERLWIRSHRRHAGTH